MKFGVEVLLANKKIITQLKKRRVALVCHPASVLQTLEHSFDVLHKKIGLTAAFGPQHGIKGEKQDNMIETYDEEHSSLKIPIFSLYGKVRRPTKEMMDHFDVLLFDLQDLGCRIYTFATTLLYLMEACAEAGKTLIVLDRPNPVGREIEGLRLVPGFESFVGAARMPMRHGLTMGELALYYQTQMSAELKSKLDLQIIKMTGYSPNKKPTYGWDQTLSWVNPSPNASNLNMARIYSGSVLLEGTTLSEGRGTTRPLEVLGAPDIDFKKIFQRMKKLAPQWMKGAFLRECFFEPTFHKHQKALCQGFQVHTDTPHYKPTSFKPFRLFALALKAIKLEYPTYPLFRDFHYEYITNMTAFDAINGSSLLREWIENPNSSPEELEKKLKADESSWKKEIQRLYLYK